MVTAFEDGGGHTGVPVGGAASPAPQQAYAPFLLENGAEVLIITARPPPEYKDPEPELWQVSSLS